MDLKAIDYEINRLEKKTNLLRLLYPTNIIREKKKFFKYKNYNPRFNYPLPKINIKKTKRELAKITLSGSSLKGLFKEKIELLNLKLNIIKSIGKKDFTHNSIKLYKKPSLSETTYAYSQVKNNISSFKKQKWVSVQQISKILKKYLKIYKLDWKTKITKKRPARIICRPKTIYIRKEALFAKKELRRLVAHEIETHILRRENGRFQPLKTFYTGFPNYEITEEGLALFNEYLASPRRKTNKFLPPIRILIRIIAIDLSLKYSFREVFEKLVAMGIPPSTSFEATLRSKRGITNTALKGAFTKDYLYLKGWYRIIKFLKNNGNLNDLYVGKVSTDNLKIIKKIKNIRRPPLLPIFYHPEKTDLKYVKKRNSQFRNTQDFFEE